MGSLNLVKALHARLVFARRTRVLADALAAVLPAGQVLDVGCGDGTIDVQIQQQRPDVTIEGIDIMARPNAAIPVARFDGRYIPFDDGAFRAVTLVDVLHHAGDPPSLLAECARVASDCVIIKDHVADTRWQHMVLRFMDWAGNRPHGVRTRYAFLSTQRWSGLIQGAKLTTKSSTHRLPLYPFPFSLVFGRRLHNLLVLVRSEPEETAPANQESP
ncbi:class I SAM-dependent methyltransferase [bacterium]|nr:class I SAM-dependent methyltransferase [bacterium]